MASAEIRGEAERLFDVALKSFTPSTDDRRALVEYGKKAGEELARAAVTTDPADKAAALRAVQGYADAGSMMIARYEVHALNEGGELVSQLLLSGLKLAIALLA